MLWNLIRATPPSSRLTVGHRHVRTTNMQVQISVEDTGIGIEPDQIGKLFNAFEQGSQNMTRQFGGLGLGLAITKALTDVHGGTVSAHSPGPHCGATFTITMPTAAAPLESTPVAAPDDVRPHGLLTILLIEDHVDTAEVMAQLIAAWVMT